MKKFCKKCGQLKEFKEFYKHIGGKHGLRSECKICKNKDIRNRYIANPQKKLDSNKQWRNAHPEKSKLNSQIHCKEWRLKNPGKNNAKSAKYRARRLQATPKWLTKEQLKEMERCYIDANELSWLSEGGLSVDHIIPLQGKNVSGLHVPWNLQILPGSLNCSKGNKF
jgi:hypothetical protein